MKVLEILQLTNSIQDLLNRRGKEYFNDALGGFNGRSGYVKSIEYNKDHCVYTMAEYTNDFDAEECSLCIFFDKLELNEKEWQDFLTKERDDFLFKEMKKQEEKNRIKDELELEYYLKLKEKFENNKFLKEK